MTRKTQNQLALMFAEWVCHRQPDTIHRATVSLWAEVNKIILDDGQLTYIFEHWHDHVELVED